MTPSSSGPSFLTLLTSGDAGDATNESSGAGTSKRLSDDGLDSSGFIQSSASGSSSTTGIRSCIGAISSLGAQVTIVKVTCD